MIDTVHSPYIHEAATDNFESLVLENSQKGPVLVNFWSRKAGPCLRQYPILDKLIHGYGGRLLLVNVDIDKEFVYTKELGVASVPTLKLFRFGKVVHTLHGYQSEADLKKVLDLHVARDSDTVLAQAIRQYAQGEASQAYQMIADAIVQDPVNPRLPLAMCKLLKHEGRYDEALELIAALPEEIRKNPEITQLQALLSFHQDAKTVTDVPQWMARSQSGELEAKKQLAAYYVTQQQYENALRELANLMELDNRFDDNYAHKAMLKVFTMLGQDHPLCTQYRPVLATWRSMRPAGVE